MDVAPFLFAFFDDANRQKASLARSSRSPASRTPNSASSLPSQALMIRAESSCLPCLLFALPSRGATVAWHHMLQLPDLLPPQTWPFLLHKLSLPAHSPSECLPGFAHLPPSLCSVAHAPFCLFFFVAFFLPLVPHRCSLFSACRRLLAFLWFSSSLISPLLSASFFVGESPFEPFLRAALPWSLP